MLSSYKKKGKGRNQRIKVVKNVQQPCQYEVLKVCAKPDTVVSFVLNISMCAYFLIKIIYILNQY